VSRLLISGQVVFLPLDAVHECDIAMASRL